MLKENTMLQPYRLNNLFTSERFGKLFANSNTQFKIDVSDTLKSSSTSLKDFPLR